MKNKLNATKNFIKRHQVAIGMSSTAGICLYMNYRTMKMTDEWLIENSWFNRPCTHEQLGW